MITVTCENQECANTGVAYNVLGEPRPVTCGGCGTHLDYTNERPDPPQPDFPT